MAIKNSFNILANQTLDPLTAAVYQVQDYTGVLTYLLILFVTVVSFYVTMKRSNDIGKSGITGLYIGGVITILLYYWGKFGDYETITGGKFFVHDFFLWIYMILLIVSISLMRFNRSSPN